ncbi:MAG: ribbon-helix-helix protein, CopG family [Actinobacteria bacterium]|nr:ribbon-helix-helix protein, CopG family [Actinomycetota bacterium]
MKRLQIMIDEDLDDALGRRAAKEDVSKAALVRRFVRTGLGSLGPRGLDPIGRMSGVDDFEPADVDDLVYR